MKSLLRSVPYKVLRFPGVKFNSDEKSYDKYLKLGTHSYLDIADKDRVQGVIGCWIAHSRVLEDVHERNGITVILEDDFVCHSQFFENALKMVNGFDRDFDIIIFDPWGTGPLGINKIADNIYRSGYYSYPYYGGTHCLFVNNVKIPGILDAKLNSQVMDYDGFLLGTDKIDAYIFYTGTCAARSIGSDIVLSHKLRFDVPGMLVCLLPSFLRERTKKFKSYFHNIEEKKSLCFSEEKLSRFEGYYQSLENEKINMKFFVKEDQLGFNHPSNGEEFLFQPISEVDFVSKKNATDLKFTKDENDEVATVIINNTYSFRKNNNYEEFNGIGITLSVDTLKDFEGKYYHQQDNTYEILVRAMEGYLLIIQLWDGVERDFLPKSELEFFVRTRPSFFLRFIRDSDGEVSQINIFDAILIKSTAKDQAGTAD